MISSLSIVMFRLALNCLTPLRRHQCLILFYYEPIAYLRFSLKVRLGARVLTEIDDFVATRDIRRAIRHPKYREFEAYYDIVVAVIDAVQLSKKIGIGLFSVLQNLDNLTKPT